MAAIAKVKISEFLAYYTPHAVVTNSKTTVPPPAHQWGYVMGGDGRVATDDYIKRRAKSSYPDNWEAYYAAYKKWIDFRVFDCNAVAEAFYKEKTGKSIDTKARLNFAGWCSTKDKTTRDNALENLPQLPGVAVFSGPTNSSSGITHVGYLHSKYGPGKLDWYVLECRGKDYGLVITKLKDRAWEWWGLMDKYYEYDVSEGGVVAPATPSAPTTAEPVARNTSYAAVCGGQGVNVRKGRSTGYASIGKADKGAPMIALPAVNGWCEIAVCLDGKIVTGYMHGDYVKAV